MEHSINKKNITTGKFLWTLVLNHKKYFLFIVVADAVWASFLAMLPLFLKWLSQGEQTLNFFYHWGAAFLLCSVINIILSRFYEIGIDQHFFPLLRTKLRANVIMTLLRYEYAFFHKKNSGEISAKINDLEEGTLHIFKAFYNEIFPIAILTIAMSGILVKNSGICSFILIGWGVAFISVALFLSRKAQPYVTAWGKTLSESNTRIGDIIKNIQVLFAQGTQQRELHAIKEVFHRMYHHEYTVEGKFILIFVLYRCSFVLMHLVNMGIAFYFVMIKKFDPSIIGLVWVANTSLAQNLNKLSHSLSALPLQWEKLTQALQVLAIDEQFFFLSQQERVEQERVEQERLERKAVTQEVSEKNFSEKDVSRGEQATIIPATRISISQEASSGIVLKNISFSYSHHASLLNDFSLTIFQGEKLGITGPSGSGKSTIVNLILGLYAPQSGMITINGMPPSLKESLSLVAQDITLFSRSLKDNIAYERPDASMEEIIAAAKAVHLHDMIMQLPLGYDTVIGNEYGVQLSGGERQRIIIARALVKGADYLVLDEATSALDALTEQQICRIIHNVFSDKTILMVTHHLKILTSMERIIVIEKGAIVQEGTHEVLKGTEGLYKTLWEEQNL